MRSKIKYQFLAVQINSILCADLYLINDMQLHYEAKVLLPFRLCTINVKPEGGPRAYVGHFRSIAFSTLGDLTKNLGPRVGTSAFFCAEEWDQVTSSHLLVCGGNVGN